MSRRERAKRQNQHRQRQSRHQMRLGSTMEPREMEQPQPHRRLQRWTAEREERGQARQRDATVCAVGMARKSAAG